jgi:hypothetical protein
VTGWGPLGNIVFNGEIKASAFCINNASACFQAPPGSVDKCVGIYNFTAAPICLINLANCSSDSSSSSGSGSLGTGSFPPAGGPPGGKNPAEIATKVFKCFTDFFNGSGHAAACFFFNKSSSTNKKISTSSGEEFDGGDNGKCKGNEKKPTTRLVDYIADYNALVLCVGKEALGVPALSAAAADVVLARRPSSRSSRQR